ncbi:unnamed protein product [Paramecium primaurelia]|uniref:Uncharacterized protein n=1 Tax=Paramecium primaurelia TaxID=5886 RepID=A0A8S1LH40_PARPR|nr:unnamed protein product [Paramecium primaurelia]
MLLFFFLLSCSRKRINLFKDIVEDKEQLTQAQQVALSISEKMTTTKWITYLFENYNSQISVLNKACLFTKVILFSQVKIKNVQWIYFNCYNNNINMNQLFLVLIVLTVFSMLIDYIFIIVMLSLIIVIYAILSIQFGIAE